MPPARIAAFSGSTAQIVISGFFAFSASPMPVIVPPVPMPEQKPSIGPFTSSRISIAVVEPENAAILAGGTVGTHLQMGIGDGLIPENLNQDIYDDIYIVTDAEAIRTSRDLARKEGIMCGISSGTNVAAALELARKLGRGKTVVTVLPDTAERYFSTPLFNEDIHF